MNGKKAFYPIWLGGLGIFLLAGFYTAVKLFQEGHWLFNANDVILWTLPLGIYIFLSLCSSGLALLSALPGIFGVKALGPHTKRLVFLALATLIGGFLAIALEIGSVLHMVYFIASPNPTSPIWWMGALYAAELVFLVVKFGCLHIGDGDSGLSRAAGTLSFLAALAVPMVLVAVFGVTESRAVFFGPAISIFYLAIALFSGTSLFILYSMICHKLEGGQVPAQPTDTYVVFHRVFTGSAGALIVLVVLKTAIEISTVIPDFSVLRTFNHPFGTLFWFPTEVIIGLFAPFILLMIPTAQKSVNGKLVTALLAWIGSLAIHMQVLINGQRIPVGPKAEQYPDILTYAPSPWEWLVALFAISVMLLLYTLGERYLNLGSCRVDNV